MAPRPGLTRAIPMALIGFIIALLVVAGFRALQGLDPVLDTGVALVVAPLFMMGFFLWGLGGFDYSLSEHHPHSPEGGLVTALVHPDQIPAEHHDDTPAKPLTVLGYQVWHVFTLVLLVTVVMFAFAMTSNFQIRSVGQAEADLTVFAQDVTYALPLGVGTFQGSQLAVFTGFILFTMFSLFLFGGAIGGLMFFLSRNVNAAKITPAVAISAPVPVNMDKPVRINPVSRLAGRAARGLRKGLPSFFGMK